MSKPSHYTTKSGRDAFDVADDFEIKDLRQFSALKYILLAHRKGQMISDIDKAIHCLNLWKENSQDAVTFDDPPKRGFDRLNAGDKVMFKMEHWEKSNEGTVFINEFGVKCIAVANSRPFYYEEHVFSWIKITDVPHF